MIFRLDRFSLNDSWNGGYYLQTERKNGNGKKGWKTNFRDPVGKNNPPLFASLYEVKSAATSRKKRKTLNLHGNQSILCCLVTVYEGRRRDKHASHIVASELRVMEIATFRLHTASLHQAIRSTGCALAYKAHGCAVIGWFSTSLIGAFWSSVFCMLVYCCSLGGPQSYSSPVVVFFDRGHPCFRNFNSTVPVDIIRVKSYVNRLFDPACVPVRVTINKLYLIPKRVVYVRCCWYALQRRKSGCVRAIGWYFTLIISTGTVELKFLKHGYPRSKNTTTGELYDCGPPREQQYTSMQNTEDRNAPIRAVENQPITAQPCAL
ncbi:hypothetical protein ACROYT_G006833 [Oculina patagonica]